jgi:hypothetical protein
MQDMLTTVEELTTKAGEVCGLAYESKPAGFANVRNRNGRGKRRFIVQGVNHPKGQPIRFKSLQRAENHIRNMGLAK